MNSFLPWILAALHLSKKNSGYYMRKYSRFRPYVYCLLWTIKAWRITLKSWVQKLSMLPKSVQSAQTVKNSHGLFYVFSTSYKSLCHTHIVGACALWQCSCLHSSYQSENKWQKCEGLDLMQTLILKLSNIYQSKVREGVRQFFWVALVLRHNISPPFLVERGLTDLPKMPI